MAYSWYFKIHLLTLNLYADTMILHSIVLVKALQSNLF